MPATVLKGHDDLLPARGAALARFASRLTERPWTITAGDGAELAAHGLAPAQVESATAVVAMFNYLTRVADASGIELDYVSPLPAFTPARDRDPAPRPDRAGWPDLGPEFRTLPAFPEISDAWERWRGYVFDSDEPLSRRQRRVLARAAAEECCDRRRADELAAEEPRGGGEVLLDSFARKLSRTPWRMGPADLQALRDASFPEVALLHAVAAVALQNAESRLAMGRACSPG
ncbi:MAG TPA: hypothetical protein VH969_29305 [Actinophytocola sp.]|uniref:hypothetical protein n=1 Tax=Actinophytocola sp. TaxID=1872138 RepID=UPI002F91CD7D